jgi:hypothetical protein
MVGEDSLGAYRFSHELTVAGFIVVMGLMGVASCGYSFTRITALSDQVADLNMAPLASTTTDLQNNIAQATTSLGDTIKQEQQKVQTQLGDVHDQVGSIDGTVTDLQKLSKTDPELLAKYSKCFS